MRALLTAALLSGALASQSDAPRVNETVQVVRSVGPAVVNISSDFQRQVTIGPYNRRVPTTSLGSGVIIDPEGFVVTNLHVIKSQQADVRVALADGRTFRAEIVSNDVEHDLALLKINAPGTLPAARLGSSDDLLIGETVIAIGNPHGHANTVTRGIISATGRDVRLPSARGTRTPAFRDFIQTDAAINEGNSGGPLLNVLGEVIGINTAIDDSAQNIGFAIPSDRVRKSLVGRLLDPSRYGRVSTGLSIAGDSAGRNVVVAAVRPDGPAARAGLRPGDRLLEVHERPIDWEFDYNVALLASAPGDRVPVVVEREGRRLAHELELEAYESPEDEAWRRVGLRVVDHPLYYGVQVQKVDPGGSAAGYPLYQGDLIDGIDGSQVDDSEDFYRVLQAIDPEAWVAVNVFRNDRAYKGRLQVR